MVNEKFAEELKVLLKGKMGDAEIHVQNIEKNNGARLTGLAIRERGTGIAPCIYLEGYYADYENKDKSMETIAEEIIRFYCENKATCDFDVSMFADYSRVCPALRGRLVNTERNRERLEGMPHREFLDLSLVYCVEVSCPDDQGVGSVQIRDEHVELWGVTERELYGQAMANMEGADRAAIMGMSEILADMGVSFGKMPEDAFPMYVLTNRHRSNGAVQILNRKALEDAAELFGSDFFILPSSVHETILVPMEESEGVPDSLARMVSEVNETAVSEEEFLSSHVYRYCAGTGQVEVAA